MIAKNHGQRQPPNDDNGAHQLQLARTLGEYVDRFAAEEATGIRQFLSEHPDLAPELAVELETLEEIASIVEVGSPLVTFGDFRILREAGRGGMGIVYEASLEALTSSLGGQAPPRELGWDATNPAAGPWTETGSVGHYLISIT